jgi:hypothetical protein
MTIWEHQEAIAKYLRDGINAKSRAKELKKEARRLKKKVVEKDSVGRPLHLKKRSL